MRSFPHSSRVLRALSVPVLILLLATCGWAASEPTPTSVGATGAEPTTEQSGPLAEVIQAAASEGEVILQMSAPQGMTPSEARQRMAEGVKDTFGVDLTITFDSSLSYNASTAKAISEIQAGSPPSYDLMYQTTITAPPLITAGAIERFEWLGLFDWLTADDLEYDGQVLILNTQFVLPAYNTNLVQGDNVPDSWEDLLDPKWKGRIGSTIYQDPWVQMAEPEAWGEERTLKFVERLAAQDPILGRYPEVHQRVVSGETAVATVDFTYRVDHSKADGAPVETAVVEPVLVTVNVGVIPKGAPHRNAAALLNAWFLTEDGQQYMEDAYSSTSLFKAGSTAAKFVEGLDYVVPTKFQFENTIRLQQLYEGIIVRRTR